MSPPTHEDCANAIDEIGHRIGKSGEIGPLGHGANGREEAAHEHEHQQEESQHEHGLLHGLHEFGIRKLSKKVGNIAITL